MDDAKKHLQINQSVERKFNSIGLKSFGWTRFTNEKISDFNGIIIVKQKQ